MYIKVRGETERPKDLKKQEAGRKGAEARKKKMEILMAELAATKEKVHASYENEHTSSAPAASELQRERPPDQKEVRNERWLWGIGAS